MSGRTFWFPKDAAWWRRSRVVELGQAHGPAGPAVIDWLTCEAKVQNPAKGGDGTVKAGYASIAHGVFTDIETVRDVIKTAVEIGVLDDFEEAGRTFTARISGWNEDIERPLAAHRKAIQRVQETPEDTGGQTATTPALSPEVPRSHVTGQESNTPPTPPRGGAVKFNGRIVPETVVTTAEAILADFNKRAGTHYAPRGQAGKPTEQFKRILGALIEHPDIDAVAGARINAAALADPYWHGPPHPGNVWGPGVIDRNVELARGTSASGRSEAELREKVLR